LKKLSQENLLRFKRENPSRAAFLSKFFFEKHNFLPFNLVKRDGISSKNAFFPTNLVIC
jgi:hypothetical protein